MSVEFYKTAFKAAVEELSSLTEQYERKVREEEALEDRMEKVRAGAVSLATLAGMDFQKVQDEYPSLFAGQPDPRIGITDAVREVLRSSPDMLTPLEIRDRVYRLSPTIAGHKNPLASIHAVIRRFMDTDQVVMATTDQGSGKTMYGWVDCDDCEERLERWVTNVDEALARLRKKRKPKPKPKTRARKGSLKN
jgi:hypothetical protein